MSKWKKLLERITSLSPDVRFDELKKVLESLGYKMQPPRSGSSHCTFRRKDSPPITIPKHGTIKRVYVEMVKNAVESEAEENENSE